MFSKQSVLVRNIIVDMPYTDSVACPLFLAMGTRETSNKGLLQGKQPGDRHLWNITREKKPLSKVVCYKCDKKGHYAQNCTEKTFHVREDTGKTSLFGEGEVNGQLIKRIQIDSGASRTVVRRSLISPSDIGEETIVVTFGNGTSGEYPLAPVRVKIDNKEYCVKAAIVQDLAEEVLLGRDVPLHKHMVKRLFKEDQMELLQQLAKDNGIQLEGRSDNSDQERVLAVLTRSQKKKLHQQQSIQDKDLDISEDNSAIPHNTTKTPEEEETPDQNPMLETEADNDFYAGQEFPFVDELFGKQRKQKGLISRGQRRRHCQRWVKKRNYSSTMQLKKEQEQDPDVQK